MTGIVKAVVVGIKNLFNLNSGQPSDRGDGVYYPLRHGRPNSAYFGSYTNNNYSNSSSHPPVPPPSTLRSSYYNSNNHWPPVPKTTSLNHNSYSIPGATTAPGLGHLSSILENNNCRKRSAEFAFKNSSQNHRNSYSYPAKRVADPVQHLTDDEDDDLDFAKPSAKRFFHSISKKTSNFYPVNNHSSGNNSKHSGGGGIGALNHVGRSTFNNFSIFGFGGGAPASSTPAQNMSRDRGLTKFTTAPKYQKKNPKTETEPEVITINSDDDEDEMEAESAPVPTRPEARTRLQHVLATTRGSYHPKPAVPMPVNSSASPRLDLSRVNAVAKEPARVPRLFSAPGYQKRTSVPGSSYSTTSNVKSSYFPSTKLTTRLPTSSPLTTATPVAGTDNYNHSFSNSRGRHSIYGTNHVSSSVKRQPPTRIIGDTDEDDSSEKSEAEEGAVSDSMEVVKETQKVDRGCGPDDDEDPVKRRTAALYRKSFGGIPMRTPTSSWAERLRKPDPQLLSKSLCSQPRNGDIFAFGALVRSKTRSPSLDSNDDNGDSTRAVGSRGSSSGFSVSSFTGTAIGSRLGNGSGCSTPRSPLSTSTDSDAKFHDDLQILSESIVSPPHGRDRYAVNSLKLEMGHNHVHDKGWLVRKVQEFQAKQAHFHSQIDYENKKQDILRQESTLHRDIEERIRRHLTITDVITLEPVPAALPEITDEMQEVIDNALRLRNDSQVLATAFNIQITRADLKTLMPCQWLNDNIINTYMDMIAERSRKTSGLPSVHVFTTFFYPKFQKEGYSNILKRWTRKVDIFSFDLLIFPIHLGVHWCLAAADLRRKQITFYDSLLGSHSNIVKALLKYLASEMKERKQQELNSNEWSLDVPKDIPTQENGSDCGVFTCKFAEYVCRDAPLTFKQENMNYYRSRMVYEIIKQDLMHP